VEARKELGPGNAGVFRGWCSVMRISGRNHLAPFAERLSALTLQDRLNSDDALSVSGKVVVSITR
jgi:hypothetical protein